MINPNDLAPPLRGKTAAEQSRVVQAILDAARNGRFPLLASDTKMLGDFVRRVRERKAIGDELMRSVNHVTRQYEQHLIARASGNVKGR